MNILKYLYIISYIDIELPKATNTSALSGKGVMRLFNKVGETVNKITYKMDESDMVRFLQCKRIFFLHVFPMKYCEMIFCCLQ